MHQQYAVGKAASLVRSSTMLQKDTLKPKLLGVFESLGKILGSELRL